MIQKFGSKSVDNLCCPCYLSLLFSVCMFTLILCIDLADYKDITSFIWKIMQNIQYTAIQVF